ncbi:MAG: hypothetical protein ACLQNG_02220 [Acidimicrobiales bacterium]|jgi:hypothetical protein
MTEAEQIRQLLLEAGDGVVPRATDPVEAVARRRSRRKASRVVALSAAAVLVAATAVAIAVSGHSIGAKTPAATTTSVAQRKVSAVDTKLWVISEQSVLGRGNRATGTRWALGPLPVNKAQQISDSGGSATNPVYVIEMRGSFLCGGCSGHGTGSVPTYHVLTLYVLASNFTILGVGLDNTWYDLNRLGKPFPLVEPPGGLTPLERHPNMAPFVGTWRSASGILKVTLGTNRLNYGGPTCLEFASGTPQCQSITFTTRGVGIGADAGRSYRSLVGVIASDTVGLAVGSQITLTTASGDELIVSTGGKPSVPIPNPWCGPSARKAAC